MHNTSRARDTGRGQYFIPLRIHSLRHGVLISFFLFFPLVPALLSCQNAITIKCIICRDGIVEVYFARMIFIWYIYTQYQTQELKRIPNASPRKPNQPPTLKPEAVPSSGIELASNPLYDNTGCPSVKSFSTSESEISIPSSISVLPAAAALLELIVDADVDIGVCASALAQFCWGVDSASL